MDFDNVRPLRQITLKSNCGVYLGDQEEISKSNFVSNAIFAFRVGKKSFKC